MTFAAASVSSSVLLMFLLVLYHACVVRAAVFEAEREEREERGERGEWRPGDVSPRKRGEREECIRIDEGKAVVVAAAFAVLTAASASVSDIDSQTRTLKRWDPLFLSFSKDGVLPLLLSRLSSVPSGHSPTTTKGVASKGDRSPRVSFLAGIINVLCIRSCPAARRPRNAVQFCPLDPRKGCRGTFLCTHVVAVVVLLPWDAALVARGGVLPGMRM